MPSVGESIDHIRVGEWYVQVGDWVNADDPLFNAESDKVSDDVVAPADGIVKKIIAPEGEKCKIGAEVAIIDETAKKPEGAAAPAAEAAAAPAAAAATPAAAAATPVATPAAATPKAAPAAAPAAPVPTVAGSVRRTTITPIRARVAQRLKASQNTAALLTTFNEIDMSAAMEMRTTHKDAFEKAHGVKLGFMSIFGKAAATALMKNPIINSQWDEEAGEIVTPNYVDLSIAVAAPKGLVVPVIRDVHMMNFADIEKSIGGYAAKAAAGKLKVEEMTGGTFTISNGGTFGSLFGTPIVNPPQSAILGMHAINKKPWVLPDGSVGVKPIMVVALTYDHRLIDGRDAVTFLVHLKKLIEDPRRMVLDL